LVDDDEALRRFVRRVLIEQGFRVIEAADGAEALEVASLYAEPLGLSLTDVNMPKINGLVLAQLIGTTASYRRSLHVRLCREIHAAGKNPQLRLLRKPFTLEALIAAVRQILASKQQD
jgi:DNA-binding response OmpR family regulator